MLWRFPDVYLPWKKSADRADRALAIAAEQLGRDDRGVYADPGVRIPAIAGARAALEQVPAGKTRQIIQLRVDGYANREIAHLLGMTVCAVESRLDRHYRPLR